MKSLIIYTIFIVTITFLYIIYIYVNENYIRFQGLINEKIRARKNFYKKGLLKVRIEYLKEYKTSLLLCFISILSSIFLDRENNSSFCKLIVNLGYSYIAGFIFYMLTVFFPDSKKLYDSKVFIANKYGSLYSSFKAIGIVLNMFNENGEIEFQEGNSSLIREPDFFNNYIIDSNTLNKVKGILNLIDEDNNAIYSRYYYKLDKEEIKIYNSIKGLRFRLLTFNKFKYCQSTDTIDTEFMISIHDYNFFIRGLNICYDKIERKKKEYEKYRFSSKEFEENIKIKGVI